MIGYCHCDQIQMWSVFTHSSIIWKLAWRFIFRSIFWTETILLTVVTVNCFLISGNLTPIVIVCIFTVKVNGSACCLTHTLTASSLMKLMLNIYWVEVSILPWPKSNGHCFLSTYVILQKARFGLCVDEVRQRSLSHYDFQS